MTTVAVLDASGVLMGFERGLPDDYALNAYEIIVPDDCDLIPGKYKWDVERQAFLPLPRNGSANAAKEVNVLRAIFRGFQAIETRFSGTLPAETKEWMNQFAKSIDNAGG